MKYTLINSKTGEKTLCEKVTLGGFDYYVSEEEIKDGDWYVAWETINNIESNHIVQKATNFEPVDMYTWASNYKKVIACTNPNLEISQVVDVVEIFAEKRYGIERNEVPDWKEWISNDDFYKIKGFMEGYNKSQETHLFSEEDIIEFNVWQKSLLGSKNDNWLITKSDKELLELWKEQQPKKVYYND